MNIHYHCPFGAPTGYARAAHDYLTALVGAGAEVSIGAEAEESISAAPSGPEGHEDLRVYINRKLQPDVEIFHLTPKALTEVADQITRGLPFPPGPKVAMTTWETDPFPRTYAKVLEAFDAIIVPSNFCARAMQPLDTPIHVVPHCYDPAVWKPVYLPRSGDLYRFYTIGAWSVRKNQIGLLKAYLATFRKKDRVQLTIVSPNPDLALVKALIKTCGIPEEELPGLNIISDRLSQEQLIDLHVGGDCFVSATRGEGWGLGAFEAMLMGNPVVMPDFGGQVDFLGDYGGDDGYGGWYAVDCEPTFPFVEPTGTGACLMTSGVTCEQRWGEPSLPDLADAMLDVHKNRHKRRDMIGSQIFEKKYGYAAVAAQLIEILEELCKT
jgi:glycosyltransferase involved in cell wall biosynthesis